MSETVTLSKASPRQRPPPRDGTIGAVAAAAAVGSAIGDVDGAGRCEKVTGKGIAGSLVMVKELVHHRDNSRLVKDLMALLAIREATKEAPTAEAARPIETQPSDDGDGGDVDVSYVTPDKNRPGEPMVHGGTPPGVAGGHAGTKAAATKATKAVSKTAAAAAAAAVASLLHHTATKEFSSLAGEIIAIADDEAVLGVCSNRRPTGGRPDETGRTAGTKDVGMLMLHADAAAATAEPHTNKKSTMTTTTTTTTTKPTAPEGSHRRKGSNDDGQQRDRKATTDATETTEGNLLACLPVGCFLSGPVPVSLSSTGAAATAAAGVCTVGRSATPGPTYTHANSPLPAPLTLEQKLDKLLESVVKIKADMHRRIDRLGRRVEQIHLDVQLNIDSTDRALLRNDLLLIGIPCREREDLQQCFRAICRALDYAEQDIPEVDIRRQKASAGSRRTVVGGGNVVASGLAVTPSRGRGNGAAIDRGTAEPIPSPPIVVEFMFKTLRDQFYRAYQAKRVLRLSDVGFSSERRFFVNEVLTKYNQKLMAEAVRRKRVGLVHSVYTVDGIVYVQRVAGEKGTKVTSFSSMN